MNRFIFKKMYILENILIFIILSIIISIINSKYWDWGATLEKERRVNSRQDVQQDVFMVLEESNVLCHLQNISCAGAYVKVNENHSKDVAYARIGDNVMFVFNSKDFNENVEGKILRRDNSSSAVFLAVYFIKQYNFPFL